MALGAGFNSDGTARRLSWFVGLVLIGLQMMAGGASAQSPDRRIALVVGNSNYTTTSRLPNAKTDALALATVLQKLKFEVDVALDTSAVQLTESIRRFQAAARSGVSVAVLYYAGHGVEIQGVTQLLPVDTDTGAAAGRIANAFQLDDLIQDLHAGTAALTVAIIDACRNDLVDAQPQAATRSLSPAGPARPRAAVRMIPRRGDAVVAYSTARGAVASDGTGDHSPFAASLLRHLPTPNLPIERLMELVTVDVERETQGMQRPWVHMSKTRPFAFAGSAAPAEPSSYSGPERASPPASSLMQQCDQLYRKAALSDDKLSTYQPYLNQCSQHPRFADAERDWLLEVERKECARLQSSQAGVAVTDLQLYLQRYRDGLCAPVIRTLLDQKTRLQHQASLDAQPRAVSPPMPQMTLPSPPAPPLSAAVPRLWSHNGSLMRLEANDTARRWFYVTPRPGIRNEGVTSGTLLFSGVRQGDTYSGTAHIFRAGCRPFPYSVAGTVSPDQRTVTLRGVAPRPGPGCRVIGVRDDVLVFQLVDN
jgi:uncharacterized caspase-like protein